MSEWEMAYERLGEGALDYYPCRYGNSKLLFRGPRRKLNKPYLAVIGGSETYGKYVDEPYPSLLEPMLDRPIANMGCVNAGTDAFAFDQAVLDICHKAEVTVIQITGAQNLSNRYYSVHPRRNDRFLKASELLEGMYPTVDFTEFHFTRHLLMALKDASPENFETVREELKAVWVSKMKAMINTIGGNVVLLWMADHAPGDSPRDKPQGHDPMFVDLKMLDALGMSTVELVEVVATQDEVRAGFDRMVYSPMEEPAAVEMLGPIVHAVAAQKLRDVIKNLI